ncbi:MAG: DUF421 domain-containing protein [Oscillospiraceae bacterium]|nr:DUF421 domain-containing protein [Oscillospiraceae bacterium]
MAISIIRTIIIFTAIVVSMRIMGKRQLGQLEPAELVVAVLISDLASHPLQDVGTPLLYGLAPVITLLCLQIIISGVMLKSVRVRRLLCGSPSVIIKDGKIVQSEMRKNRLTIDELGEELRKKDVTDISSVRYAVVETDGSMSVILFSRCAPLTPQQADIQVADSDIPLVIINDGRLIAENLRQLGKDERWLRNQLHRYKVSDTAQVFMMSADRGGGIYVALMEEKR